MLQNLQEEFTLDDSLTGMSRHHRALDYFEEVLIRLCLTAIAIYRENGQPDPKINTALEKLSQPSMGAWNNLFNMILKWHRRVRNDPRIRHGQLLKILQEVSVTRMEDPQFLTHYKILLHALQGSESGVIGLPFRSLADATIRLRNRVAHGGMPDEDWLNRTATAVDFCLRYWARSVAGLGEYKLQPRNESFASPANSVYPVALVKDGEELFDYDCLLVERDGLFFNISGNERLKQVHYVNHVTGKHFNDSDVLLKKQIVFFAGLREININEADLGSRIATSPFGTVANHAHLPV